MLMGVHTNMCVLGRPFGLRNLARSGKNVVLVRDLTDTMYNSRMWPYVSHFEGTNRIVEHIEKYVAPTITSTDLTGQPAFQFKPDDRPRAVFLIGEDEYKTETTLPAFATKELEPLGVRCTFVIADPKTPHDFPGIEALNDADLLVLSVRRRAPDGRSDGDHSQVYRIGQAARGHSHGLPCVRHARQGTGGARRMEVVRSRRAGRSLHRATMPTMLIPRSRCAPGDKTHVIIAGRRNARSSARARSTRSARWPRVRRCSLMGTIPGQRGRAGRVGQHRAGRARVFYTSLGHPDDFENAVVPQDAQERGVLGTRPAAAVEGRRPRRPAPQADADGDTRRPFDRGQGPRSPRAALASFKVPDDLKLELVLAEPVVRQPVSISFDERGRLWVVQYLQYPNPGRAEDGEPRRRLARRLRQGPAAAAAPLPRQGQDHDSRRHRRRRRLRPAQDVCRRPEHRHVGGARAGRRVGAQSAVSCCSIPIATTTTCPTAIPRSIFRASGSRTRTRWSTVCSGARTAGSTRPRARRSPAT